jgi:hypothetical protein
MAASSSRNARKRPPDDVVATALARRGSVASQSGFVASSGPGNLRTFVLATIEFVNRIEVLRRQIYGGDLDLARVADAIGLGALEHRVRDPAFLEQHSGYDTVVGVQGQRGVNAQSVADATGIPRETVRRKIKILLAKGAVQEKTRGKYIMKPGFMQTPETLAHLEEARRFALHLREQVHQPARVRIEALVN